MSSEQHALGNTYLFSVNNKLGLPSEQLQQQSAVCVWRCLLHWVAKVTTGSKHLLGMMLSLLLLTDYGHLQLEGARHQYIWLQQKSVLLILRSSSRCKDTVQLSWTCCQIWAQLSKQWNHAALALLVRY
jgi:hypothetical protein